MDTRQQLIKARLGLLALAEQLRNVRWACQAGGISRSHCYEIKQDYEKYGAERLAPQLRLGCPIRRFWTERTNWRKKTSCLRNESPEIQSIRRSIHDYPRISR